MSSTFTPYAHAQKILCGEGNWTTNTIKVALITSGYTFNSTHTLFDNGSNDATNPSYNELAGGNGYTAGGATLTASKANTMLDANDVSWSFTADKTFRCAIIYISGTVESLSYPVLGHWLFDSTPADITVPNGQNFTIVWHPNGIFSLSLTFGD